MPPSPQAAQVIERQTGVGGAVTPDALADLLAAAELGEMTAPDLSRALFTQHGVDAATASVNSVLYHHQDRLFEIKRRAGLKPVWGLTDKAAAARAGATPDAGHEALTIFIDAGSTPDVLKVNDDLGGTPLSHLTLVLYVDADYQGKLPTGAGVTVKRGVAGRPALDLDVTMALDACATRYEMSAGEKLALVGQAAVVGATARVLADRFPASTAKSGDGAGPTVEVYATWTACRNACL